MSEIVVENRFRSQSWAAPGGLHDHLIRLLKLVLPALIGLLMAYLAMAPLTRRQEISFILDKNKVEVAKERMRVQRAHYRGQDAKGRPFSIVAHSAVQESSRDPNVNIRGMSAELRLDEGPAWLRADRSRYNLESQDAFVVGPIYFTGPDNYRLETRDVTIDLDEHMMSSEGRVDGTMPLGNFSADRLQAGLDRREVTLQGNARLHIVQGGLR